MKFQEATSPEEKELQRKLAELSNLESELVQSELELATIQAQLSSFTNRYVRIVVLKMVELDEINLQIAKCLSQIYPEDKSYADRVENAYAQFEKSNTAVKDAPPDDGAKFEPSDELKQLYRDLAKKIHPDFATDENDRARRTKLMTEVNNAYKAGDINKLSSIWNEWSSSPDAIKGDDIVANLLRAIRKCAQITLRISVIKNEIEVLKAKPLYTLLTKSVAAKLENRDLLQEMADDVEVEISIQGQHLENLKDLLKNK